MKNYGLVIKPKQSDQYVLGAYTSLPKIILQSDGQWEKYLPIYEAQADKYETWGCTVWGTQNGYEIIFKRVTGKEINADERYNYNCVELMPPGADPHEVAQSIKNDGLTFGVWLMPDTLDEFRTPRPVTEEDKVEGRKWRDKYIFGHEWVNTDMNSLKEALMYSPVCVSVTAWYEDADGFFVDRGEPNNHWCVLYGYYEENGQTFWKIFDSYDHSQKILHPSHKMMVAKRFHLEEIKETVEVKLSLFQRFLNWLMEQLSLIRYFNARPA